MCAQSIEEFVIQNKLRPSLRVRMMTLWTEIRGYRDSGYSIRTIWQYFLSEKKIPQISYSRFAAVFHQLAEKQPATPGKSSAQEKVVSPTSTVEKNNVAKEYEPRRGTYQEPKPFVVTTTPPSFEQLFSKKLAEERASGQTKKSD